MAFTWTAQTSGKGIVKYGTDSTLALTAIGRSSYSDSAKLYVYKVNVRKLKAGTRYYYKCWSTDDGWSAVYHFQTAPKRGSTERFVVGVWGDTQDNEFNTRFEKTDTIVKQLIKFPIQFTIHMGDIVENGSQVKRWLGLFNVTQPVNAQAPFMPVTGNHDVNNDTADVNFQKPFPVFYQFQNLPGNNIDYSFDYGNTHFVAISSGHAKGAEVQGNWRYSKNSSEYKWLDQDLAKARKDKNITWIILYMHHPIYSFGWSHVQGWQENLTPLVDKYKIDLCLAGHRHVYERHKAIRRNIPAAQTNTHQYIHPEGTVYITNGTAGGSPQGIGGAQMPSMVYTSSVREYNYAIMTITGRTIRYDVYNQTGDMIDYFLLKKSEKAQGIDRRIREFFSCRRTF
jgi:predicted phosphodiesterase